VSFRFISDTTATRDTYVFEPGILRFVLCSIDGRRLKQGVTGKQCTMPVARITVLLALCVGKYEGVVLWEHIQGRCL